MNTFEYMGNTYELEGKRIWSNQARAYGDYCTLVDDSLLPQRAMRLDNGDVRMLTNDTWHVIEDVDPYELRDYFRSGQVFRVYKGDEVLLDRRVPGDETRWYVAVWCNGGWSYEDHEVGLGDLIEYRRTENIAIEKYHERRNA